MTITDALLTPGAAHGRPGTKIAPVGVTIHYVGNAGSSAAANRNYFETGGSGASSHYIVGLNGEILRLIPEDEKSNHAGKAYGNFTAAQVALNNVKYISIEVCHPDASGKFGEKTYAALIELVADICRRRGWGVDKATRHYDIAGKACPLYYVNNKTAWERLKADVAGKLAAAPAAKPAPEPEKPKGEDEVTQEQFNGMMENYLKERSARPASDWAKKVWEKAAAEGKFDGTAPQGFLTKEMTAQLLVNLGA